MGDSDTKNLRYLFFMKDDLNGYTWLYPSETADSEMATYELSKCIVAFGYLTWIFSNLSAHFTAAVMKSLVGDSPLLYHFTTAYCPGSSKSIECTCRKVLKAYMSL